MWSVILEILIGILMMVLGLGFWRLQSKISKMDTKRDAADKRREEEEKTRQEYLIMSMRLSCANTKLSKATTVAVINNKVNGEMEDALEYMKSLEKEQEMFIQ